MNSLYILYYISSLVLVSVSTVIFWERKSISQWWTNYKRKRIRNRDKHLKSVIEQIVLEYLKELSKDEQSKDDNNSNAKKL